MTDPKPKTLSLKSLRVLGAIRAFIDANGYSPTVRELRTATGLTSTCTIHRHIHLLIEAGRLSMQPGCVRTIRIIDKE